MIKAKRNKLKHIISISILLILLFFAIINFNDVILRFFLSCKVAFQNILYYFKFIIGFEELDPILQVYDFTFDNLYEVGKTLDVVPKNYDIFKLQLETLGTMMIDFKLYFDYILIVLSDILSLFQISIMFIFILPLYYYFKSRFFKEYPDKESDISLPLKIFNKFRIKVYGNIKKSIINYITFLKEHRFYVISYLLLILFIFNIYSIILDIFGVLFYFVSSWEVSSLYKLIIMITCDLFFILKNIPNWGYYLIIYLIICFIRKSIAFKRLNHFQFYNFGVVGSLGVLTMEDGAPGTGKTLFQTSMLLDNEELLRKQALDIMLEISRLYPNFNFYYLEQELYYLIDNNSIKNHFQIKEWILEKKKKFIDLPIKENIFNYDFINNNIDYYNHLFVEDIFSALSDYACAFFFYSMNSALSFTNYAVRHDGVKVDLGYLPMWDYNSFKRDNRKMDLYSNFSKIIDYDAFRLGKKFIENNPNSHIIDCAVVGLDEIDKERGNIFLTRELRAKDDEVNQVNDGFDKKLKMIRHNCTVRNRCFVKIYMTTQRANDLGASSREINEYILSLHKDEEEFKSCVPFWFVEPYICKKIISFRDNIYCQYRFYRFDNTLLFNLINYLAFYCQKYLDKYQNTFDVKKLVYSKSYGTENENELREDKYFLIKKKIFAERYSTDCYSGAQKKKYLESNKSFDELQSYESKVATEDELRLQNSYFVLDLLDERNKK